MESDVGHVEFEVVNVMFTSKNLPGRWLCGSGIYSVERGALGPRRRPPGGRGRRPLLSGLLASGRSPSFLLSPKTGRTGCLRCQGSPAFRNILLGGRPLVALCPGVWHSARPILPRGALASARPRSDLARKDTAEMPPPCCFPFWPVGPGKLWSPCQRGRGEEPSPEPPAAGRRCCTHSMVGGGGLWGRLRGEGNQ